MRILLFLSLLVIAAGCATTGPTEAITGDQLHHADLRLSVTKPAAWRFQTAKEKHEARYAITYKNKTLDSLVKLDAFPPRIVISKYPEPRAEFNPGVAIDRYPLEGYRFKNGTWVASQLLKAWQNILDRVEIVEPVRFTTLAGKPAGYYRVRYTLGVKGAEPFRIEERVWAVGVGLQAYVISARGLVDGPEAAAQELDAIVASITFDAEK